MAQSVREIKMILQAEEAPHLPDFIQSYREDSRAGVQALVACADKKYAAYQAELERTFHMGQYERKYAVYAPICGIDEAGRGPLAGPVVAGAVILPDNCNILYLNDSKQLTENKREELYQIIMEQAIAVGVGYAAPERIDEINILQATYEAMRAAVRQLTVKPGILLNDAVTIPLTDPTPIKQVPIIKGDAKSISIAAASIIAKVTRDRLMVQYDSLFPEYGFASHKGYGSAGHIDVLKKSGPTPIHRKSFIKNFVEDKCESVKLTGYP